jgi:CheY-like chemotaxis protein
VGVGTRFDIYLPASGLELTDQVGAEKPVPVTGSGRILVMDDQESIRKLLKRSLSAVGYEVVTSVDGTEAIEKYREAMASGNPFHAVILDLTVPGGMGGAETHARLKEIDPAVTCIVASGYSDDAMMTDHRAHGFRGAIAKPYRLDDLRRLLHEVISEG